MARRNPAPRTARDLYAQAGHVLSVLSDLETEMEGAPTKTKKAHAKALQREARGLVKQARKEFPEATVPTRVRPLIPFTKTEIVSDLKGSGHDVQQTDLYSFSTDLSGADGFEFTTEGITYRMLRSDEAANAEAIAYVREMLVNEPENFNQDFIARHIDQERLTRYVYDSEYENNYVDELAQRQTDDFWRMAEQFGFDVPEESDENDWERPDPDASMIESVKTAYANDMASRPAEYFRDIYAPGEVVARMIEAAGIDIDSAAKEAVQEDGWAHFLSHYDGNYDETPAGFVFWREE